LKSLVKEALKGTTILRERPWSIEYGFKLSGGVAEDSEGEGPDGFSIVMTGDSGKELKITVDTYWNPTQGDQSGNSIKVEGETTATAYVPHRFDDGKEQTLIISNAPVPGLLVVSHSPGPKQPPVAFVVIRNPFNEQEDVTFNVEKLGNGDADVELKRHVSM